ncbi:NCS2 family permease [Thiospirochaeta perfilievii]|uniref:NCS2 family permease n=1 Tax=Thiospirochaeta perfilievii TaxID=252967 RepID=A0A5C1QD04_9SPIO|nr:NCS2 family permease [Thiospirochaeta perfilievii]QEN06003.1 NCS2 family permease [Thiospirochaeta perfilievii]
MEKFFKLKEHNTTVKTEVLAGITTFMTMAYILAVNPGILSATGMDANAVFLATAISAGVATLVMALVANLPFALAPGMGLNALFAFTVVLGMGYSWEMALAAVFIEGIIFIILTFLNVREAIINCIPVGVKKAVSVGIGLFIAFIGLYNSNTGIVQLGDANSVPLILGKLSWNSPALLIVIGLLIISILLVLKVHGALLIGILASTVIGIPMGITPLPTNWGLNFNLSEIAFKFDFSQVLSIDMLVVLFTFLFVDMFDTVGTLIGVSTKAGMLTKDGKVPNAKQALLADAIGTTFGACMGTSTVTTYVESASGVTEGGRTGLTALTTSLLFFLAIFLSPIFLMIPSAATAPALIIVGVFMMSPVVEIKWNDYLEAIPAFLTIIMMPLTYSIAEGIAFGMTSYVLLHLFTGKGKKVAVLSYIITAFFIIDFFLKSN